jgi:hypothetical protein
MGEPTDQMAGWLADALVGKFGSWAAFDKARKRYNAQTGEQRTTLAEEAQR